MDLGSIPGCDPDLMSTLDDLMFPEPLLSILNVTLFWTTAGFLEYVTFRKLSTGLVL